MKNLVRIVRLVRIVTFLLILVSLTLQIKAVTVTASSVSTFPGAIGYSTVLLHFDASGAWTDWRLRVNPSASCAAGAGTLQGGPPAGGTTFTSGYGIIAGGLATGQHYWLCVELSSDGGASFSPSGALGEVQATTLSTVENEPRPIKKFQSSYPNTGDFATMPTCPSVNGQGYCRTPGSTNAATMRGLLDTAIGDQCTHGTIIAMPHSNTPIAYTSNIYSSVYAACPVLFWDAAKISGNVINFGVAHGLTEGQLLTYGNHGFITTPSSSSCYFGNGFVPGSKFLVHVVNSTSISLVCGDGSGNAVVISSPGTAPSNTLFLLPHVSVSGLCPSVQGVSACTYQKVNSFEVIIRSDAADNLLPPPGTKITPGYCAAGLCSIWVNPASNVGSSSSSNIFFTPGNNDGNVGNMVSKVRLGPGIELTNAIDPGQRTYANLINTQVWGSDNTFDRVYFHGGETRPPTLQRWGGPSLAAATLDGYNTSIRDSYIDNLRQWHSTNGIDGSSIIISQGPGPGQLVNDYIEGAGILIHLDNGGGTTYLTGDYSFLRNTFHSPTFMMHGAADSDGNYSGHRQHWECKGAWGVEYGGNIHDTNWVENNPNSEFAVMTSVSPPGGQGEGCIDVNMFSNTFMHGPGGIGMPLVVYGGGKVTIPPARFAFRNNLLYDIDGKWTATSINVTGAKGWMYQGPAGGEGAITDHNTMVGNNNVQPGTWTPLITRFQQTPFAGWQFTNNFSYNFVAPGWGMQQEGGVGPGPCFNLTGEALSNACLTPSYIWANNVMMSPSATSTQIAAQWPTVINANYNPVSQSLSTTPGWIQYDPTGATVNSSNYGLRASSNYRSGAAKTLVSGPATDGNDVGIDEQRLRREQGRARFVSVTNVTSSTATVNFVAPDTQSCPVRIATTSWGPNTVPSSGVTEFADSGTTVGPRSVNITGLTMNTVYYGIILCAVEQPTFVTRTKALLLGLMNDDTQVGSRPDQTNDLAAMVALHAKIARNNINWGSTEPSPGVYNWTAIDNAINDLVGAHIQPHIVLYGSPSWANGSGDEFVIPAGTTGAFTTWKNAYAAWATVVTNRYKDRVHVWELWNEQNDFYLWKPVADHAQYSIWYTAVYNAIKAADPTATVMLGGLDCLNACGGSPGEYKGSTFLQQLYTDGLTFDVISLHPYPSSNNGPTDHTPFVNTYDDVVNVIRPIIVSNGNSSARIWVTEIGWSSGAVGLPTQALYTTQAIDIAKTWSSSNVDVVEIFALRDIPGVGDLAIINNDWTFKPAGTAFQIEAQ